MSNALFCGCDPDIGHLCERHDALMLDSSVDCPSCGKAFDVTVARCETTEQTCPHCHAHMHIEHVEYLAATAS